MAIFGIYVKFLGLLTTYDTWDDPPSNGISEYIPTFNRKYCTSSIRVHFSASYASLPECSWNDPPRVCLKDSQNLSRFASYLVLITWLQLAVITCPLGVWDGGVSLGFHPGGFKGGPDGINLVVVDPFFCGK